MTAEEPSSPSRARLFFVSCPQALRAGHAAVVSSSRRFPSRLGHALGVRSPPLVALVLTCCAACAEPNEPVGPSAAFDWAPLCDLVPAAGFSASLSEPGDAGIVSYAWDFGDGGGSADDSPGHRFDGEGPFTVSLTVTDANGQQDTAVEVVDLGACLEIAEIGTLVDGDRITASAEIRNVSGYRDALVAFTFTILDADGLPWHTEVDGGQHEIADGSAVSIGGFDWRECGGDCSRAAEVTLEVASSYWAGE